MKVTSKSWVGKMAVLGLTAVGIMIPLVTFGIQPNQVQQIEQQKTVINVNPNMLHVPHTFLHDTPAIAGEVNENFQYLLDTLSGEIEEINDKFTSLLKVINNTTNEAIPGHITVKVPASSSLRPTLKDCGNSTVSGADSVGTITIEPGGGIGQCTVVFGTPFAEAPTCVFSSDINHPSQKFVQTYLDHITIMQQGVWDVKSADYTAQDSNLLGNERVRYICIGFSK